MMILALMSPVKDEPYELEPKDGYEIAMILDASQSMQAKGFDESNPNLNRFDVVKEIVSDFIEQRKSDNIGLVVFGAYSFIASPLTYDEHILKVIQKLVDESPTLQQLFVGGTLNDKDIQSLKDELLKENIEVEKLGEMFECKSNDLVDVATLIHT